MYLFELAERFFKFKEGRRKLCKQHLLDFHYIDEVKNGEWYYHGYLVAKYVPPALLLDAPGNPSPFLAQRLSSLAYRWRILNKIDGVRLSVFYTPLGLVLEVYSDEQRKSEMFLVQRLVIMPAANGVEVLGRRVLQLEKTKGVKLYKLGYLMAADGRLYLSGGGGFYVQVTLDELRQLVHKAGLRSKLARLIKDVSSEKELVLLLDLMNR